ncbi:MAG: dTDP-4-dehydrorhamnose reductase [Chloroflexota bacterium]|nr:MAG: dTDP-4-dehydrorhamnose reductase [Chloroflexota bacterium]
MRVLVTGGRGQLAADLVSQLVDHEVIALGRDRLDVRSPTQIRKVIERHRPQIVVNTAAFHRVDRCESEPEQSFLVNAAAPRRLAEASRDAGALLVHFSTDYVFDGEKAEPYVEDDPVRPLSVYGASKAAGESAIRCTTDEHLIVRSSGLYGHRGQKSHHGNFVETMLRLSMKGEPIPVVADQVLTPTYTRDLAAVVRRLIEEGAKGTYHVTNGGACSWYEFSLEIMRLAGKKIPVLPTSQLERPLPARRPAYSVLAHDAIRRLGIEEPRPWQEALAAYMDGRSPA